MCAEPADGGLELAIQVVVEQGGGTHDIGVSFNGCWPRFGGEPSLDLLFPSKPRSRHVPEHHAVNFRLDVGEIRDGWNEIVVLNGASRDGTPDEIGESSFKVVSLELAVRSSG